MVDVTGYSIGKFNQTIIKQIQRTEAIFIGNPNLPKQKYGRGSNRVHENFVLINKHAIGIKYDKLIQTIEVPKTAFKALSDPIIKVPIIIQRTVNNVNALTGLFNFDDTWPKYPLNDKPFELAKDQINLDVLV